MASAGNTIQIGGRASTNPSEHTDFLYAPLSQSCYLKYLFVVCAGWTLRTVIGILQVLQSNEENYGAPTPIWKDSQVIMEP